MAPLPSPVPEPDVIAAMHKLARSLFLTSSSPAIQALFAIGLSAARTGSKDVNEILNSFGMLTSNWSNRMAHMDIATAAALPLPSFWPSSAGRCSICANTGGHPTAGYQWRDLFANAAPGPDASRGRRLAAIAIAYLYDTLWGWRLFDIELNLWSVLLLFLLQDLCYWLFHFASHHALALGLPRGAPQLGERLNLSTAFRQSLMYPRLPACGCSGSP